MEALLAECHHEASRLSLAGGKGSCSLKTTFGLSVRNEVGVRMRRGKRLTFTLWAALNITLRAWCEDRKGLKGVKSDGILLPF